MLTCGKLVLINKDFETSNFEGGLNEFIQEHLERKDELEMLLKK